LGESPSARTDRELTELRTAIDADLRALEERVREDLDPRRLAKRNPLAVFGALASVIAIGSVTTVRSLSGRSQVRSDTDIDALIARLGGRINKLRGPARKRLRKQLREEIGKIDQGPRAKQMIWDSAATAITAALTLVTRRFASRLVADDELPRETIDTTARPSPRQLK
jgi:outer membrane translocation and assembly module TamA